MIETTEANGAFGDFNLSNYDRVLLDRKEQQKTSLVSGRLDLAACRMMADSCGLRRSVRCGCNKAVCACKHRKTCNELELVT